MNPLMVVDLITPQNGVDGGWLMNPFDDARKAQALLRMWKLDRISY